jgi:hypothetical protein
MREGRWKQQSKWLKGLIIGTVSVTEHMLYQRTYIEVEIAFLLTFETDRASV